MLTVRALSRLRQAVHSPFASNVFLHVQYGCMMLRVGRQAVKPCCQSNLMTRCDVNLWSVPVNVLVALY
jgi:hypothetical protein